MMVTSSPGGDRMITLAGRVAMMKCKEMEWTYSYLFPSVVFTMRRKAERESRASVINAHQRTPVTSFFLLILSTS